VLAQVAFCRNPKSTLLLGRASANVPQRQSLRARRPAQRRDLMEVPAGAVKVNAEKVNAGTVNPVIRLDMPRSRSLRAGHAA
jgi:hypothetical protein